jgi:large subunit ribosomal protein L15
MLELNNLRAARGARRNTKRLGRGPGSGQGTTAGRGYKGQGSRSGVGGRNWFEGGQMPLYRRVPKRGFVPRNRVENQVVNLSDFERFDASREIDAEYLRELGMVSGPEPKVKVLGSGEVNGAFRVKVHAVSAAARSKIEEKGGTVEILPYGRPKQERKKSKGKAAPTAKAEAAPPESGAHDDK